MHYPPYHRANPSNNHNRHTKEKLRTNIWLQLIEIEMPPIHVSQTHDLLDQSDVLSSNFAEQTVLARSLYFML